MPECPAHNTDLIRVPNHLQSMTVNPRGPGQESHYLLTLPVFRHNLLAWCHTIDATDLLFRGMALMVSSEHNQTVGVEETRDGAGESHT